MAISHIIVYSFLLDEAGVEIIAFLHGTCGHEGWFCNDVTAWWSCGFGQLKN
jgi:hypothetical protein